MALCERCGKACPTPKVPSPLCQEGGNKHLCLFMGLAQKGEGSEDLGYWTGNFGGRGQGRKGQSKVGVGWGVRVPVQAACSWENYS